jgi:hypothetical protein
MYPKKGKNDKVIEFQRKAENLVDKIFLRLRIAFKIMDCLPRFRWSESDMKEWRIIRK